MSNERYRKIEVLGSGGMGEVWLVHDEQLGCYWAMKCLYANSEQAKRTAFLREVELLTKLHHPGIPRIVERLEEAGELAVVMDLVEGVPLSTYCEPISEEQLLDFADQILDVLEHVHAQGILYLDLKPDNIMLDLHGALHLIDFGIACYQSESQHQERYGTIGYAPKEQYAAQKLDERCDIYAFGKTLIALVLQVKDAAVLEASNTQDLAVSQGLRMLIEGCVNEVAELRYRSVAAVREDLSRIASLTQDIAARTKRYHHLMKGLQAGGCLCLCLALCCTWHAQALSIQAYETAIQRQDYPAAIALNQKKEDAYLRYYEQLLNTQKQQALQTVSLEEARSMACKEALARMQELRLDPKICSNAFLLRLAQDAWMIRDDAVHGSARTYIEELSRRRETQQIAEFLTHMEAGALIDLEKMSEALVLWMQNRNKEISEQVMLQMVCLLSQEFELQIAQLKEAQFHAWSRVVEHAINWMEDHPKAAYDLEQRQLLEHAHLKSLYEYAKWLGKQRRMEEVQESCEAILAKQEELKQIGKQDEQIAVYAGHASMLLFQTTVNSDRKWAHLMHSKALYEEALRLQQECMQAQEGLADCERLLVYWRSG